jgi:hypothetical protein
MSGAERPDDLGPFDIPGDDPHIGPGHLPGPDVGGSVTIDSDGHVTSVTATVPGTAEGSQDLQYQPPSDGNPPAGDAGWMPPQPDAQQQPPDIFQLPPPEGSHWDPITHIPVYDPMIPSAGPEQEPGDYPDPDPNTSPA